MSNDALHKGLELANSKLPLPPPFSPFNFVDNLNPLPSSRFLLTLSLGSGGNFLASTCFPQEFKKKIVRKNVKTFLRKILK